MMMMLLHAVTMLMSIFSFLSVHGSQISLMSGGSSMYGSTTEEQRQANEVRRLKRELHDARDQVMSLSSQLSTNVSETLF
jgi:neuron navigator 2